MTGIVAPAIPGMIGFDTDTVLTSDTAAQFKAAGFSFVVRYLSRVMPQNSGDLQPREYDAILAAGLAIMLVQHCPPRYWTPTDLLAEEYGRAAAVNATTLGYPKGGTVWLDLENMRPDCGIPAIVAYCNAWSRQVRLAGFQDGLYYGAEVPPDRSGQRNPYDWLYLDLITTRYWRSGSRTTPYVPMRGVCVQQFLEPAPMFGIDIDRDVIMADAFGGLPTMVFPRGPA